MSIVYSTTDQVKLVALVRELMKRDPKVEVIQILTAVTPAATGHKKIASSPSSLEDEQVSRVSPPPDENEDEDEDGGDSGSVKAALVKEEKVNRKRKMAITPTRKGEKVQTTTPRTPKESGQSPYETLMAEHSSKKKKPAVNRVLFKEDEEVDFTKLGKAY